MEENFEKNAGNSLKDIETDSAKNHEIKKDEQQQNSSYKAEEIKNENVSEPINGSVRQERAKPENGTVHVDEMPDIDETWNKNEEPQINGTQQVGNEQAMDGTRPVNGAHRSYEIQDSELHGSGEIQNFKRFPMDNGGKFRMDKSGATVAGNTGMLVVLGWISAALTFLISPLFSIAGIIFGVMVNRETGGRGNAIIITNIVLAALGVILGLITSMLQY